MTVPPTYVNAGAGNGTLVASDPWTVPCPASVINGNLLIMHVAWNTDVGFPSVSGWTLLFEDEQTGYGVAIYARKADGSEGADEPGPQHAVNPTAIARMYQFNKWLGNSVLIDNIEGANVSSGSSTTISDADITTTDGNRLCVQFISTLNSGATLDSFTGETGGDWVEAVSEYAFLGNAALQLQIATLLTAGTIGGGSDSITSSVWNNRGFAILPQPNLRYNYTRKHPRPIIRTMGA